MSDDRRAAAHRQARRALDTERDPVRRKELKRLLIALVDPEPRS